ELALVQDGCAQLPGIELRASVKCLPAVRVHPERFHHTYPGSHLRSLARRVGSDTTTGFIAGLTPYFLATSICSGGVSPAVFPWWASLSTGLPVGAKRGTKSRLPARTQSDSRSIPDSGLNWLVQKYWSRPILEPRWTPR